MRVAVVDVIRILDESLLGKVGADKLRALFEAQQRDLAPHQGKNTGTFANQKIADKQRQQEGERERLRAGLRDELLRQVQPIITKIASEAGFDMVIARPQSAFFVKPELDITQQVMSAVDALPLPPSETP